MTRAKDTRSACGAAARVSLMNSAGRRRWAEIPGYNLHIMLVVLGCAIGLTAVIAIVRVLRGRSTLNENRMMRDYLRWIASDRNRDF